MAVSVQASAALGVSCQLRSCTNARLNPAVLQPYRRPPCCRIADPLKLAAAGSLMHMPEGRDDAYLVHVQRHITGTGPGERGPSLYGAGSTKG